MSVQYTRPSEIERASFSIIREELAREGVVLLPENRPVVERVIHTTADFDFAREGWIADFNDPINMLEMWITDSGNNDCQFGR